MDPAEPGIIERTAAFHNAKSEERWKRQRKKLLKATLLRLTLTGVYVVPGILLIILSIRRTLYLLAGALLLPIPFLTLTLKPGYLMTQDAGVLSEPVGVLSQKQIGPHAVMVVNGKESADLASWIGNFIRREQGDALAFDSGRRQVLEAYIGDGYRFFAPDVIEADPESGPVAPLRYTFPSKALYFPLRISSRAKGITDLDLFLLNPVGFDLDFGEDRYADSRSGWYWAYSLTSAEIEALDPFLGRAFPGARLCIRCMRFQGPLEDLKTDLVLPVEGS